MKANIKRVPLRRCKRCRRYVGYCPLEDLNPCVFLPKIKEKKNDNS